MERILQSIDSLGLFWLPDHDGDQLSGRLKFDPAGGGINLSLVGAFDNAVADGGEPTVRIFGWLGNNPVTLESCYSKGSSFGSPDVAESSYQANRMFLGHHVESELQEFQSAEATFSYADVWVGHSGIKVWRDQSEPAPIYIATYTPTARDEQPFTRGHIQLGYRWQEKGDSLRGVSMRQWPVFATRYDEPHSLKTIMHDVRLLQNLMTLCVDTPVYLDKLIPRHPDVHIFMLDGSDSGAEQPIELVNSPIPYIAPGVDSVTSPECTDAPECRFTGVQRWRPGVSNRIGVRRGPHLHALGLWRGHRHAHTKKPIRTRFTGTAAAWHSLLSACANN